MHANRCLPTPAGAAARGLVAGAAGTLAMDVVWYARFRRRGGNQRFLEWEFSSGVDDWEGAPVPAQVGRRLVEGSSNGSCHPGTRR
jgi:hypothetical protein